MPDQVALAQLRDNLLARYDEIFHVSGYPRLPGVEASQVPPSIPFLGYSYLPARAVLVYGSAESMSNYERSHDDYPAWTKDPEARDRHRRVLELWDERDSRVERTRFPNIHIQPCNDGGLLIVAAFLLELEGRDVPDDPRAFLESLSVANFSKFAIRGRQNLDCASNEAWIDRSVPYVQADLDALWPRLVVLTKSTMELPIVQRKLGERLRRTRTIGVMQCQVKNVRFHLGHLREEGERLYRRHSDSEASRPRWHRWLDVLDERKVMKREELCTYLVHVDQQWKKA